jgi:hypothetical protein
MLVTRFGKLSHRVSKCAGLRNLLHKPLANNLSSSALDNEEKSIYTAKFTSRITFLRRFSFISSCASVTLLGVVASGYSPSSMALFGQYVIAGSASLGSVGGTAFVHLVTSPYVTELVELVGKFSAGGERKFRASTLNLFGNKLSKEFTLKDVGQTIHPFASCKIGTGKEGVNLYIYGGDVDDVEVRNSLTKEKVNHHSIDN